MTNDFINNKKQLFDLWAPIYDWLFPSVFYQAVHKRLLEYVDLPVRSNVLDIGCGTGQLLERLANQFSDLRGTGLDLSSQMLHIAVFLDVIFWAFLSGKVGHLFLKGKVGQAVHNLLQVTVQ